LIENPILRSFELLDVQCFHLSQSDKSLKLGVPNCDTAPAVWIWVYPSSQVASRPGPWAGSQSAVSHVW